MTVSRRQFVKSSLALGALSFLPWTPAWGEPRHILNPPRSPHPIRDLTRDEFSTSDFTGDDIERTHELLWDIEGLIRESGGLPPATEDANVVVIGGGMAGLYAAYQLRDLEPILLEQDRSFGGNSRGERFEGGTYSIGAAYITTPGPGTETEAFLKELGLWPEGRIETSDQTTVFINNRFARGFWSGTTDPQAQADFLRVNGVLEDILAKIESEGDESLIHLDQISFQSWMDAALGEVHPHIREYLQLYAWSSFCASLDELSAYQMLGFIAAETGSIMAFPGGNAAITDRLYTKLHQTLGPDRLRSEAMVLRVRIQDGEVLITYATPDRRLKTVRARAVIFAAPKFVARRLIEGLSSEQDRAMQEIKYRAYVVANIILDRPVASPSYELYCLKGHAPEAPTAGHPSSRPFTDICFGTWAQFDRTRHSVWTVYRAFSFDGDKQLLFSPFAHDKNRARVLDGLQPILQNLGLSEDHIKGVRMTRWGHAIPIAKPKMVSGGVAELAHQPIQEKIFFANQDNWVNPCFETATGEASLAARAVRKALSLR